MVAQPRNIDSLFDTAIRIQDAEQRARYLDLNCQDARQREELERLLAAHEGSRSFLNEPPPSFAVTLGGDSSCNQGRVLRAIGEAFGVNASVSLCDAADGAEEPLQNLASTEVPRNNTESRYQLFGEIARGGMGAIIKGRDTDLGRELAVKVLLEHHKCKPEVVQRFVEEAQIGGQLQHPGIAPVYELGQFADQRPYFTMKLVKGKTLAALLDARKSVDSDRARFIGIFEQVCQTMAYAHSRGVIHRDLKPANIMVGAFGEVQVMDWGLAKVLSSGGVADEKKANQTHQDRSVIETLRSSGSNTPLGLGSQTQVGSVMGTPAYMPPEQALGEIDQLDQRADVFGLGAILCEILTGKPPYVADEPVKVFRLAARGKLDECFERIDECNADAELVDLVKACLSGEPADRPRDASVLADRISEHQEAVEMRLRESEVDRAAKTARVEEERKRRRVSMALAASIVALVLAVGGGGLWIKAQETVAAKKDAVAAQEIADKANQLAQQEKKNAQIERDAKEELRWVLYQADIQRAQTEVERGNYSLAKQVLMNHVPKEGERDLRSFEWHYLYRRCPAPNLVEQLQWDDGLAESFYHVVSDNGGRIAAITESERGLGEQIAVWNTKTGKKEWSTILDTQTKVLDGCLSDDGRYVGLSTASATAIPPDSSTSFEVLIWDVVEGKQIAKIDSRQVAILKKGSAQVVFRPGTTSIAIQVNVRDVPEALGKMSTSLVIWDFVAESPRFAQEYDETDRFSTAQEVRPARVVFSPDGLKMALPTEFLSWPVESNPESQQVRLGYVKIIDAETGEQVQELRSPSFRFSQTCAFSLDGTRLAMAATDDTIYFDREHTRQDMLLVWNVNSGALEISAPLKYGHGEVRFSPSGELVVVVPRLRHATEVFRVRDGSPILQTEIPRGSFVSLSDDEQQLETIDQTGETLTWQIASHPFDIRKYDISGNSQLSGNGKRIFRIAATHAHGVHDEYAKLFDTEGRLIHAAKLPWTEDWRNWQLNHDGTVAIHHHTTELPQSRSSTLLMWNLDDDGTIVELYRPQENEELLEWHVSPGTTDVAGIVRVTSSEDNGVPVHDELRLWDQDTQEQTNIRLSGRCPTTGEAYFRLGFSHDGKTVGVCTHPAVPQPSTASQVNEQTTSILSLYDLTTGDLRQSIAIPGDFCRFTFSHDLRLVAGANRSATEDDERTEIWELASGRLVQSIDTFTYLMAFSRDGKRLLSLDYRWTNVANRHTDVFNVYDVATGVRLLSRIYYGGGGSTEFHAFTDRDQFINLGYYGLPQFWDGRPVEVEAN